MFWSLNLRREKELSEKMRGKKKYLVDYIPTTKRANLGVNIFVLERRG
jgi:hypothetical protein